MSVPTGPAGDSTKLSQLIDGITDLREQAENVKHYLTWSALSALKRISKKRKDDEDASRQILQELQQTYSSVDAVVVARNIVDAQTVKLMEDLAAVKAARDSTRVMLTKLQVQDAFQGLGAIIERKYAYVLAWLLFYLGLLVSIVLGYPGISDWIEKKSQNKTVVAGDPLYLLRGNVGPRQAVFPVYFKNARGEVDGWKEGIELDDPQRANLAFLMKSLEACIGIRGKPAVRLEIYGFASSKEFETKGRPVPQNARWNMEAANRRALSVATYLRQLSDNSYLDREVAIKAHSWEKFEQMMEERPYNDRPEGSAREHLQEAFDRVAEVRMVRAGSCEPLVRSEK